VRRWLLLPFRLVREWAGVNLCFFELHHFVPGGQRHVDEYGRLVYFEKYGVCSRCRRIRLPIIREEVH
jgi:hypothetical protein